LFARTSLGSIVPLPRLVMNGKMEGFIWAQIFRSSSHQLTIDAIAYGIMAHLVMSDLLINPFSFIEPTHT